MDRRKFLRRGLLGGALLFGAGLFAWPARSLLVLEAVARRMVPGCDAGAVAQSIEASLPDDHRRDLHALLALFDVGFRRFASLSPEQQDAQLIAWRDSGLTLHRSGYQVLRRLCLSTHYADRSTHLELGYPGPRPTGGVHYDDSKAGT